MDMFRDLLVHVDGSPAGRRRVQFAVGLAKRMSARLSGLHVTPSVEVPPRYKPSRVDQAATEISAKLALDARAAAMIFREEAADACWFEAAGDMVQGIIDKARYADVVILGQYERQGVPETHPLPIAHPVVLRCGRPVLVVPAVVKPGAFARIAIAWDGSREAVRAVHDALPLLRMSRSVEIVTMIAPSAEGKDADAKSLSAHLANHGIEVGTNVLQLKTAEEHESLRKHLEQGHYDLLVMGGYWGYSHAIWREFIFGGATNSILLSSKIPILVSH
jgi:nucleotide-binding universal stress UspA family protein